MIESFTGRSGSRYGPFRSIEIGSSVVVRGMTALANRCTEVLSTRPLPKNQENGSKRWNTGCYDDDVHFNAANQRLSLCFQRHNYSAHAHPFHISSSMVCPSRISAMCERYRAHGWRLTCDIGLCLDGYRDLRCLDRGAYSSALQDPISTRRQNMGRKDPLQNSHTQKKCQQHLFPRTQLKLPHDINWDQCKSEVQERPITWRRSN